MDIQVALSHTEGNAALLREIVQLFLDEGPRQRMKIEQAFAAGDSVELARSAHSLKGTISVFGAEAAYNAAREVEMIGRSGDLTGFDEAWSRLLVELDRLLQEMNRFLGARVTNEGADRGR